MLNVSAHFEGTFPLLIMSRVKVLMLVPTLDL